MRSVTTALPDFVRIDGDRVTLILTTTQQVASIAYWGPKLGPDTDAAALTRLAARAEAPAAPAIEPVLALTSQSGQGGANRPGLAVHRDGRGWATLALLTAVETQPGGVRFTSFDAANGVTLVHDLRIDGDILVAMTTLGNTGVDVLTVDHLDAPQVPLPGFASQIIGFEGRWAAEFATTRRPRTMGQWVRENRRGRTSHDAFPGVIVTEAAATETQGLAFGFHLGWSGNHRLVVETLHDGRGVASFGALWLPGEMRLAPAASITTPPLFASVCDAGLTGLSQQFHRYLRGRPAHARLRAKPRPVHFNSWEAVYFDQDPAVLIDMASRAAAIGIERFVLDDGWFKGRRSDRAGLGDWTVDPAVWPDGLAPLVDHVGALGMEFGLWIEPEMVNPDSDLFRAHPDWVLGTPPAPQLDFRHQQVLDFGRADVRDDRFAAIATLLRHYPIAYLKWDMNRDISHPGGADGRAGADAHVHGVHAVLDRLRAEFPLVEIESCASGGGRADYGVLARTDRIWTSDSNDALDRLAIQRGFSHFFPAEVMGSHVGPSPCHITGRRRSMALRVATALFGHMGVELDLRTLCDADTATLAAGIALHKAHRGLIHSGDLVRLDTAADTHAVAIIAPDQGEALVSCTCLSQPRTSFGEAVRLTGLDPAADYDLAMVWPRQLGVAWPLAAGGCLSGEMLMRAGIGLPRLWPGTAVILHLTRH